MDRLRILTADYGSIPNIADYGHIKTEPINCHGSQIITIKQELPTATQFFVKSEIHDNPQCTPDDQKVFTFRQCDLKRFIYTFVCPNWSIKNCMPMPSSTPPTPSDDTSDK